MKDKSQNIQTPDNRFDEELNQALLGSDWNKISTLLEKQENKQFGEECINNALLKTAAQGKTELVKKICTNWTPPQESINGALMKALSYPRWETTKYLCSLQSANKPNQATINRVLKEMISSSGEYQNWELVMDLLQLQGDNKPDTQTIEEALLESVSQGQIDLTKAICQMTTVNKPRQEAINKAIKEAVYQKSAWHIAVVLCNMQGDNKPDTQTIEATLQYAIIVMGEETLDFIRALCAIKTDNKPGKGSINRAVMAAATCCNWERVNYLLSLKTENKPDPEQILKFIEQEKEGIQQFTELRKRINRNQPAQNTNIQPQTLPQKSEEHNKLKTENKPTPKEIKDTLKDQHQNPVDDKRKDTPNITQPPKNEDNKTLQNSEKKDPEPLTPKMQAVQNKTQPKNKEEVLKTDSLKDQGKTQPLKNDDNKTLNNEKKEPLTSTEQTVQDKTQHQNKEEVLKTAPLEDQGKTQSPKNEDNKTLNNEKKEPLTSTEQTVQDKTQPKNNEEMGEDLKTAIANQEWKTVTTLCSQQTDNHPNQAAVSKALTAMIESGPLPWDQIKNLCQMTGVNQPDATSIRETLRTATSKDKWEIFDIICSLQTENRPNQKAISEALSAIVSRNPTPWDQIKPLCKMTEENQPDATSVENALTFMVMYGKIEYVKYLCAMTTNNKPQQSSVTTALIKAIRFKKWEIAEYLGSLKTPNKPDVEVIIKELRSETPTQAFTLKEIIEAIRQKDKEGAIEANLKTSSPYVKNKPLPEQKDQEEGLSDQMLREGISNRATIELGKIISGLSKKIGTTEQKNRYIKAYNDSVELLKALEIAKEKFINDLKDPKISISQAATSFKNQCVTLIEKAEPTLKKDLGWGDYLTNLLRSIVNAVLWAVSFGKSNTFFALTKSESLPAAKESLSKIKDGVDSQFKPK